MMPGEAFAALDLANGTTHRLGLSNNGIHAIDAIPLGFVHGGHERPDVAAERQRIDALADYGGSQFPRCCDHLSAREEIFRPYVAVVRCRKRLRAHDRGPLEFLKGANITVVATG